MMIETGYRQESEEIEEDKFYLVSNECRTLNIGDIKM